MINMTRGEAQKRMGLWTWRAKQVAKEIAEPVNLAMASEARDDILILNGIFQFCGDEIASDLTSDAFQAFQDVMVFKGVLEDGLYSDEKKAKEIAKDFLYLLEQLERYVEYGEKVAKYKYEIAETWVNDYPCAFEELLKDADIKAPTKYKTIDGLDQTLFKIARTYMKSGDLVEMFVKDGVNARTIDVLVEKSNEKIEIRYINSFGKTIHAAEEKNEQE